MPDRQEEGRGGDQVRRSTNIRQLCTSPVPIGITFVLSRLYKQRHFFRNFGESLLEEEAG